MSGSKILSVSGRAIPLVGDDIDTDRIMPARHLRAITFDGLEAHLFGDDRKHAANQGVVHPIDDPRFAGASLMIVNRNFGCGSSREHAPWALMAWGFRAVISSSFADIFRNNALKNGLLPIEVPPEELGRLFALVDADPDAQITVDLHDQELELAHGSSIGFHIDGFARRMILEGTDELGYLLSLESRIVAYEADHPPRVSTLN